MTKTEQQRKVLNTVGNYLAEHLEKNGPVTSLFRPCMVRFAIIHSENEGMMKLFYKADDQLSLQLGVYRQGTDRLYSNFFPTISAADMIRYLRDPASHQEWLKQVAHLSDSVDDFWD